MVEVEMEKSIKFKVSDYLTGPTNKSGGFLDNARNNDGKPIKFKVSGRLTECVMIKEEHKLCAEFNVSSTLTVLS